MVLSLGRGLVYVSPQCAQRTTANTSPVPAGGSGSGASSTGAPASLPHSGQTVSSHATAGTVSRAGAPAGRGARGGRFVISASRSGATMGTVERTYPDPVFRVNRTFQADKMSAPNSTGVLP